MRTIDVRDVDFNFGPGDQFEPTLGPDDKMTMTAKLITLDFADGEHVEIDRARVRWFAIRPRKVMVPVSLDPADSA